jgi:hypothetical protein
MKKTGRERISNVEKSSCNFGWNQEPNYTTLYRKLER